MELVATAIAFLVFVAIVRVSTYPKETRVPAEQPKFRFSDDYSQTELDSPTQVAGAQRQSLLELIEVACTKDDIDLLLRHMRLKRKELLIERRELAQGRRAVLFRHTQQVRQQFPKFPGGGELGRGIRTLQTIARHHRRVNLAAALEPGTATIEDLDLRVVDLERQILVLERKRLAL